MFLALNKIRGNTIFYSDNIRILKITQNAIDGNSAENVINNINSIPKINHWSLNRLVSPRYPEFIVLFYNENNNTISASDIEKIEQEASTLGFNSDIQKVSQILKCHSGKEFKFVKIATLFYSGSYDNSDGVSIDYVGKMKGKITSTTFELDIIENNEDSTYLHFSNEFETINIPIVEKMSGEPNMPKVSTLELVSRIKNRSSMSGRVCSTYTTYRSDTRARPSILAKQIPVMKIDEMLTMFGTLKKCQTKVETLAECLRGWTQKYSVPSEVPIGKNYFIEINSRVSDTTYDTIPLDWILTHASLMKIVSSEVTEKSSTRLIVQISDKPVDDFAQMLYASLEVAETNRMRSIGIIGLTEEVMDSAIANLKSTIEKNGNIKTKEELF